jgi:hypothetical protein
VANGPCVEGRGTLIMEKTVKYSMETYEHLGQIYTTRIVGSRRGQESTSRNAKRRDVYHERIGGKARPERTDITINRPDKLLPILLRYYLVADQNLVRP